VDLTERTKRAGFPGHYAGQARSARLGTYMAANFLTVADGYGGTLVTRFVTFAAQLFVAFGCEADMTRRPKPADSVV
jgi:hypothetical protein